MLDRKDKRVKKAIKMANKLGVLWYEGAWPDYEEGKGHAVSTIQDLSHEIAHFIVSPKKYRNTIYHGLGPPGGLAGDREFQKISNERCVRMEEEASLLGLALMLKFGCSLKLCADEAAEHSWDKFRSGRVYTYVAKDHPESVVKRMKRKKWWSKKFDEAIWKIMAVIDVHKLKPKEKKANVKPKEGRTKETS